MKLFLILILGLSQLFLFNCELLQVGSYVKVQVENKGAQTNFVVTSSLARGLSLTNAWLGIAFGSQMVLVYFLLEFNISLENLYYLESFKCNHLQIKIDWIFN